MSASHDRQGAQKPAKLYDAFGPQRLLWGTDFPHIFGNIG